jgi:peptidoglycan hydrolase-like protein with peptidoglycan-binding domain
MEILAYSHLTQTQDPEELITLSSDRLRTLTAMAGVFALGSVVFQTAPAAAQSASLSRNDSGPEVTRVQDRLAALGYFDASSTGFFGSITEDAVIRFQQDQGLETDGVVGPQTLAALFETTPPQPSAVTPSRNSSRTSPQTTASEINTSETTPSQLSASANPVTAQLQRDLDLLGYDPGPVDGVFGSRTAAAISAFQRAQGLPVNGVPGIDTLQALEAALKAGGSTSTSARVIPDNPSSGTTAGSTAGSTATNSSSGTTASGTTASTGTAVSPSAGVTQVKVQNNQDSIVVQRGTQTGRIVVQNDPSRTYVEALKTVPIQVTDRVASIPPLSSGTPIAAAGSISNLGMGGADPYAVQTMGSSLPYVVAIPDRESSTVGEVQALVPGAYRAQSSRGVYVYAGSFANRRQAEDLSEQLRAEGLDARVAFRP